MKNLKTLRKITFITIAFLALSCSKDDNGGSSNIPSSGSYINAKINGNSFSTTISGVSTASASRSGTGSETLIFVIGSNIESKNINLTLYGITAPGTYTLNSDSDSVMSTVDSGVAYSTGGCGVSGTLKVTAIDATKIEGTFSFTGKDTDNCATSATKTVTNGSFRGVFAI